MTCPASQERRSNAAHMCRSVSSLFAMPDPPAFFRPGELLEEVRQVPSRRAEPPAGLGLDGGSRTAIIAPAWPGKCSVQRAKLAAQRLAASTARPAP